MVGPPFKPKFNKIKKAMIGGQNDAKKKVLECRL